MIPPAHKYPRTPHLSGSRLQPGDEDLQVASFEALRGRTLVVEEKVDGANTGISFGPDGGLRLQSRGHVLAGGPREAQFALFKGWASRHQDALRQVLGTRYVLYGEWLHAKHAIFNDLLPHYFLAFDVLDTAAGLFLDTPRREGLLAPLPVASVPVLARGTYHHVDDLLRLLGPSRLKSPAWRAAFDESVAATPHADPDLTLRQTDRTHLMEGLYVKVEDDGVVRARYKFVRDSFRAAVSDSGSHWQDRPLVWNRLTPGAHLFAETLE